MDPLAGLLAKELQDRLRSYYVMAGIKDYELTIEWMAPVADPRVEAHERKITAAIKDIIEEKFQTNDGRTGRNVLGSIRRRSIDMRWADGATISYHEMPESNDPSVFVTSPAGTQDTDCCNEDEPPMFPTSSMSMRVKDRLHTGGWGMKVRNGFIHFDGPDDELKDRPMARSTSFPSDLLRQETSTPPVPRRRWMCWT